MVSVDETFEHVLTRLSPDVAALAQHLPFRLGLVDRPDGKWSDFTKFEVVNALPAMCNAQSVDPAPFVMAHQSIGFFFALVDRVADGQVVQDDDLLRVRGELREVAISKLGEAIGSVDTARSDMVVLDARFAASVREERRAFRCKHWTPRGYALAVADKTSWMEHASVRLLEHAGAFKGAAALRRAQRLLILSLQLFDDATDCEEDRDLRGSSIPALLGHSRTTTLMTARLLGRRAGVAFAECGMDRVVIWLHEWAMLMAASPLEATPVLHAMGALVLEEALLGQVVKSDREPWRSKAVRAAS